MGSQKHISRLNVVTDFLEPGVIRIRLWHHDPSFVHVFNSLCQGPTAEIHQLQKWICLGFRHLVEPAGHGKGVSSYRQPGFLTQNEKGLHIESHYIYILIYITCRTFTEPLVELRVGVPNHLLNFYRNPPAHDLYVWCFKSGAQLAIVFHPKRATVRNGETPAWKVKPRPCSCYNQKNTPFQISKLHFSSKTHLLYILLFFVEAGEKFEQYFGSYPINWDIISKYLIQIHIKWIMYTLHITLVKP